MNCILNLLQVIYEILVFVDASLCYYFIVLFLKQSIDVYLFACFSLSPHTFLRLQTWWYTK